MSPAVRAARPPRQETDAALKRMREENERLQPEHERVRRENEREHALMREVILSDSALIEKLAQPQTAVGQAQIALGEAERRSDERLNALILTVEKYISRNGHA